MNRTRILCFLTLFFFTFIQLNEMFAYTLLLIHNYSYAPTLIGEHWRITVIKFFFINLNRYRAGAWRGEQGEGRKPLP